jgi:2-polyprenyl-3-methyl-5-hydroxy-6-metoxy-1,4-benzoquinol methylase
MFWLNNFACPVRFAYARRYFKGKPITILDVGCGDHSPTLTKRWFPGSTYHGADIQEYNIDAGDKAAIDRFFPLTTEIESYDAIPENTYDFIILNHVLEHTTCPHEIVKKLCKSLKSGGVFWLAFPSLSTLKFPAGGAGTLHFCDDPTHIRLIDVRDVANDLLAANIKVVWGGRTRTWLRYFMGMVLLPWAYLTRLTGRMQNRGTWYFLGFEDSVIGVKR